MSAEIINLRAKTMRPSGNAAREALIEVGEGLPNTSADDAARWADWLLAELWMRGFKAVPFE